ncbi:methylosome subunit pICln-like [Tropilaelaps mercedesae]|uniref:Methylosome subunit pICln n=1 Tax=Tropilaelaps mercedesae TaxID=418985 RepID=A0A1V9XQ31_9ACAR|nr:methylosome subunit pICln-like [Tropilaelaps mercedesae]
MILFTRVTQVVLFLIRLYAEKGTLLISESRLCWSGEGGTGFSLEYPAIQLHAVSRDPSLAPRPCLYLIVEGDLPEATSCNEETSFQQYHCPLGNGISSSAVDTEASNRNGAVMSKEESCEGGHGNDEANDGNSSIESDGNSTTEIRFIPPLDEALPAMYAAMCECQALHPDSNEQEDYESDNDGEEYDVEEAEQHLGVHQQNHEENGKQDQYMEGQFDDAD